jgi:rod shape determining protein RodA
MRIDSRRLQHIDWFLVINGLMILGVGLLNLVSATSGFYSGSLNFIIKQLIAFCVGLVAIALIAKIDHKTMAEYALYAYVLILVLILFVLFFGAAIGGSKRWFVLWGFSLQPSELMKPVLVVFLAGLFRRQKEQGTPLGWVDVAKGLAVIIAPVILVVAQPDLGTGIILFVTGMAILWFVGMRRSIYVTFSSLALGFLLALPYIINYLMKPYQLARIKTWISILMGQPVDISGAGYHARQAMIAVGSGRLFGKGYMAGTQHKLQFIPEHHTDFAFTVIAEEWGFVGAVILLILFSTFLSRCLKVAKEANDGLASTIVFGVTAMIFFQFAINILMTVQIFPVVGVPLPFISYGGSSLLSTLMAVGLILNIRVRRYMF